MDYEHKNLIFNIMFEYIEDKQRLKRHIVKLHLSKLRLFERNSDYRPINRIFAAWIRLYGCEHLLRERKYNRTKNNR